MKRCLAIVVASLFILTGFSIAQEKTELKELSFGIIATESTANLKKGFGPFLKELEEKIGLPIEASFAPDYAGVIEAMRFGKIQVAWFGNKSAIEAVDRADGEVFAQTSGADGSMGYYSVIIVHKDSPYQDIDQVIKGGSKLVFGNGDPNSTSGYLIPTYYIWSKQGIDPTKHFRRVRNTNHEANCMAVAMKQVDFATNNTECLERFQQSNPRLAQNLRVIWKSPMIPKDPLVWRKDLDRELKARVQAAILSFGRVGPNAAKEQEILKGISQGWGVFYPSDNRQLIPVRELGVEKERQAILNNSRMSEAEKQERLAEVSTRHENLQKHIELSEYWNSVKQQ